MADYAIVVGVSDYPGLGDDAALPGAAQDAVRFHAWLCDPVGGGLSRETAKPPIIATSRVANPLDAEPAYHQIQRAFRELSLQWARNNAAGRGEPLGRRLWVYFAGHGANLARPGEPRVPVWFAADAREGDAAHVAGVLWAMWTAQSCLFEELVVIVDACGIILPNVPVGPPPGNPNFANRCAVFSATSATSPEAWEIALPGGGRGGKFTSLVLDRLRAAGGTRLTAADLYRSLRSELDGTFSFVPSPQEATDMILVDAVGVQPAAASARFLGGTAGMPRAPDPNEGLRGFPVTAREPARADAPLGGVTAIARGEVVVAGRCGTGTERPLRGWALIGSTGEVLHRLDDVVSASGTFSARVTIPSGAVLLAARTSDVGVVASSVQRVLRPSGDEPVMAVVALDEGIDDARALCSATLYAGSLSSSKARETIQRWVASEAAVDGDVRATASGLGSDSIGWLMVAILAQRAGDSALLAEALERTALRGDDPDVSALAHGNAGAGLPRFVASWQARIGALAQHTSAHGAARLTEAERAISCRRVSHLPWLAWFGPSRGMPWEVWMANTYWPGWDNGRWGESVPSPREVDLSRMTLALEAAPDDLRDQLYKRPPVPQMVAATRISFVGATNDQLAPALASAFQLRGRKRWERLELFFLDDAPLWKLRSDGRTGDVLLRDRDVAEAILTALLPCLAQSWVMWRSPEGYEDDTFASLWDLDDDRNAWVHVSRYDGHDVRTSKATNVTGAADPAVLSTWQERIRFIRSRSRRMAGA
jgi:hypothetical protein